MLTSSEYQGGSEMYIVSRLLYRHLFLTAVLWLCTLAISCSDGNTSENISNVNQQSSLSEKEYISLMESQEKADILSEVGVLPDDLRGWTIEEVIEKIGVPDSVIDGHYAPEVSDLSDIPKRYRSGIIMSLVYTRKEVVPKSRTAG